MILCERLRAIRQEKGLTQGDVESRTGLKRFHISRLEHGRTIPSIATLEKIACALEVPLYRFFCDGVQPPKPLPLPAGVKSSDEAWGNEGDDALFFDQLRQLLGRINEADRQLLLQLTTQLVRRTKREIFTDGGNGASPNGGRPAPEEKASPGEVFHKKAAST